VFILSNEVGRIIVDKTGLAGKYDIALKWTPDEMAASAVQQANASPPPAGEVGPSIFTALEEQLGLKLESAKGPSTPSSSITSKNPPITKFDPSAILARSVTRPISLRLTEKTADRLHAGSLRDSPEVNPRSPSWIGTRVRDARF